MIIEKTALLRVSDGPSRSGTAAWNVFALCYPTPAGKKPQNAETKTTVFFSSAWRKKALRRSVEVRVLPSLPWIMLNYSSDLVLAPRTSVW